MMSASEIARAVGARELDPVEVVQQALEAIEEHAGLNAVLTVCAESALERARGGVQGRLAGVPLLVKDLIDVAGTRTTFGSRIYADRVATETAPCVRALEAEGAIVVAKTNLDEFAWGVGGHNAHYGPVQNPLHPGRITGGSSSGNAAGLAVGMGALALGTDTGGSVRLPAAGCGVVGFKPELGAISTAGVYPLAPSFDTVGPMARTVEDCALAWSVLTGQRPPEARAHSVAALERAPSLRGDEPDAGPEALPAPEGDIWPVFEGEALGSHRATWPARAADYGGLIAPKLEAASRVSAERIAAGYAALHLWRERAAAWRGAEVVVSPTLGLRELPGIEVHERVFRFEFSAYTRVFSFLGWSSIAIGETQLAARDARTLFEAALARE